MALLVAVPAVALAQRMSDATAASGMGGYQKFSTNAAWGDYDGDGDLDLYVTNWGTSVSMPTNALYENQGGGRFIEAGAARGVDYTGNSTAAAWADYDNDGDLDLYVADFYEQDALFENRDGSFTEIGRHRGIVNLVRQGAVTSVSWGDYDGDGNTDLYLGKYYYANELYHNEGNGLLAPVTDLGVGDPRDAQAVNWVDYDGDGDLDLYVVNREQENTCYRNDLNQGGAFAEVGAALGIDNKEIGQGAAWGDYDNDGDLDLFLANVGANALYRHEADGRFANVSAAAGIRPTTAAFITAAAGWADFDGDGDLDLYLATGSDRQPQRDLLLTNSGDGTFRDGGAAAGLPSTPTAHMAAVWGDADGNGSPDLYVTDGWGVGNALYRNESDGGRFLRVVLRGRGPAGGGISRDAIGAQVRLLDHATGALRGYRQVIQGANAAGVIFGAAAGSYDIEVRFPGRTAAVRRANVTPGQTVYIDEEP